MSQDNLGLFVAFYFDDDAHAVAVAFVANVGDAFQFLILNQLGDVPDQAGFVHLIRKLGDDDILTILAALLDGNLRAHLEGPASGFVSLLDSFPPINVAAGRKIGTGDKLHHFFQVGFGLFDQQDGGFDCFFQVVRRDICCHAHGDAG